MTTGQFRVPVFNFLNTCDLYESNIPRGVVYAAQGFWNAESHRLHRTLHFIHVRCTAGFEVFNNRLHQFLRGRGTRCHTYFCLISDRTVYRLVPQARVSGWSWSCFVHQPPIKYRHPDTGFSLHPVDSEWRNRYRLCAELQLPEIAL